jgi:hypothetical protein
MANSSMLDSIDPQDIATAIAAAIAAANQAKADAAAAEKKKTTDALTSAVLQILTGQDVPASAEAQTVVSAPPAVATTPVAATQPAQSASAGSQWTTCSKELPIGMTAWDGDLGNDKVKGYMSADEVILVGPLGAVKASKAFAQSNITAGLSLVLESQKAGGFRSRLKNLGL